MGYSLQSQEWKSSPFITTPLIIPESTLPAGSIQGRTLNPWRLAAWRKSAPPCRRGWSSCRDSRWMILASWRPGCEQEEVAAEERRSECRRPVAVESSVRGDHRPGCFAASTFGPIDRGGLGCSRVERSGVQYRFPESGQVSCERPVPPRPAGSLITSRFYASSLHCFTASLRRGGCSRNLFREHPDICRVTPGFQIGQKNSHSDAATLYFSSQRNSIGQAGRATGTSGTSGKFDPTLPPRLRIRCNPYKYTLFKRYHHLIVVLMVMICLDYSI